MTASPRSRPRIAALGPDDAEAMLTLDAWAFAADQEGLDHAPTVACFEWDRSHGAYLPDPDHTDGADHLDGADDAHGAERLAGISSVYSLGLPVPGAAVDAAGLTWIGVHPQFRRRGVLTAMIRAHLNAVHDRGEPVSVLWASEPTIYGRFGYGIATRQLTAVLPRGAALRDVPGAERVRLRFETVDVDRHADVVGDCYEAARQARPGMISRNSTAQRRRHLIDPPAGRGGGEQLRILIAEPDAVPGQDPATIGPARGYALFRRRERWDGQIATGTVVVKELVARDPAAARALWGRLLDLDLMADVETDLRATDDALFQLADPRGGRPRMGDGLWVRIVDLPTALSARRYSAELDVVLEVRDELCPWNTGRWHLVAGPGHARCTPVGGSPGTSSSLNQSLDRSPPDDDKSLPDDDKAGPDNSMPDDETTAAAFTLDVRELGAAYLGSISLDSLAAAGLITVHDQDGFAVASRAFAWPVAAYCGWVF